ncbi:helix-turn-helix transcriptional regulator [Glycomyces halotolerans]
MLHGRAAETAALASLLDSARASRGAAVVVRGEAGIGKSSLVNAVTESAGDFTVLRCVGVESENAWSYSGLQALLLPLTGYIGRLPAGNAAVLNSVLGLEVAAEKPERLEDSRFRVGVAVLSLLAEASASKPVLCVIDDAHWLDRDSADLLLFVARRLAAEPVAMIFAARDGYAPDFPAPGIDELVVGPLDDEAAARLLGERLAGPARSTRERILQAAQGNPLALLELPPVETDARLAASFPGHRHSTTARLKQAFTDRIDALPEDTRTLLRLIAADFTGDPSHILAAAERLGISLADLAPAEADGLVRFRHNRFEFGHPLIRNAAFLSAPTYQRIEAHRALADVFEPEDHRRTFHLAAAATGPDEDIAARLERTAECAAGCGGHAVEYSNFERAASLTPDGPDKGRRLLRGAEAALNAGNGPKATELAEAVGRYTNDRVILARATSVAAAVTSWGGQTREAYRLWMEAAHHYMAGKPEAAGYPLFRAVELAWQSGDFSRAEVAAEHAERLGIDHAPIVRDLAVAAAGFNRSCTITIAEAMQALGRLIDFHSDFQSKNSLSHRVMRTWWYLLTGDVETAERDADELIQECRAAGAAGPLPRALVLKAITEFHRGRWSDAEADAAHAIDIATELGQKDWPLRARAHVIAPIAALRGDEERAREQVETAAAEAPETVVCTDTALALLDLGLGRYEAALDRYMRHFESDGPGDALVHVPAAVEAAVRAGEAARTEAIVPWFELWTESNGKPHWAAMAERCRGLLADDADAGKHYERAAELHREDGRYPFEAARTDLLLGEWLRRARRVNEAKTRLRAAAEAFEQLGAKPWTEKVRRELRAAGDAGPIEARPGLAERLTAQELQVVRLAAAGLSNREIGEQLYLSPRTAGYHLYKAYPKLGVSSRTELAKLNL